MNEQTLKLNHGRGNNKVIINANVIRTKRSTDKDGNKVLDVYYVTPTKLK